MSLRTTIGWHWHKWSLWYDVGAWQGVIALQQKKCVKCNKKKERFV